MNHSTEKGEALLPSVEADASPRESAMAVEASREVGRPEDGDEDGDDSSYYEYLSENPRKAAETIERLETQVEELKAIRRSQIAEIERLRAGLREDQIEQFARRIQAIAERWKGANGGIYTIRAMALDMAHTLAEERAISVSDGSLKGQDAQRLDPKDASAVGCKAAETPLPDPVAGIVERLREQARGWWPTEDLLRIPVEDTLYWKAAGIIQSLSQSLASAEKERDDLAEYKRLNEGVVRQLSSALASKDAEIERLRAERDEARRQEALCRSDGNVEIGLRKATEARIAEMEKALEPLANWQDYDFAMDDTPIRIARAALSKGGTDE